MKRVWVMTIFCVLISYQVCFSANAPIAVVPESVHTFKKVVEGRDILHDFIIKNHGNASLDITKVIPG